MRERKEHYTSFILIGAQVFLRCKAKIKHFNQQTNEKILKNYWNLEKKIIEKLKPLELCS